VSGRVHALTATFRSQVPLLPFKRRVGGHHNRSERLGRKIILRMSEIEKDSLGSKPAA
jgi:hypothetical protein